MIVFRVLGSCNKYYPDKPVGSWVAHKHEGVEGVDVLQHKSSRDRHSGVAPLAFFSS